MRKFVALAVLLSLGFSVVRAADDDAKKLEGTYTMVEMITEGKPNPKVKEVETVVIQGDMITIKIKRKDKEREEKARFKLDPSQKPGHIDITPENNDKDKQMMGIYKSEQTDKGLVLTMAFGGGGPRPTDFKGEGDDAMVMKLLKKK